MAESATIETCNESIERKKRDEEGKREKEAGLISEMIPNLHGGVGVCCKN